MIVAGLDWSTTPSSRAVVRLEASESAIHLVSVESDLDDPAIVNLCTDSSVSTIGIDTPFGWPATFVQFVSSWAPGAGSPSTDVPDGPTFALRQTDHVVTRECFGQHGIKKKPLSVSSNLIGLSARYWCEFLVRPGWRVRVDVHGQGHWSGERPSLVEVYPAGSLGSLFRGTVPVQGYKGGKKDAPTNRTTILNKLVELFSLDLDPVQREQLLKSDDKLDALVAALTALLVEEPRKLADGTTWAVRRPRGDEQAAAEREGWIWFPVPERESA